MKRVLISTALLLVCILSFSQERVNTNTYLQFNKTTKALKKAMGYNGIMGEWEGKKNQIHSGFFGDSQDFIKLTVKTLTQNDTLYYVLIKNYDASGSSDYVVQVGDVYKYVGGGGSYNRDELFFFTKSEFEQIFHLDKNVKTINSFRMYSISTSSRNKSDKLPTSLVKEDKKGKKDFMNIRIADDGIMVRFLLPYHKDETWDKDYDIFPKCYFEMPLKDFNKWLEPVSPLGKQK